MPNTKHEQEMKATWDGAGSERQELVDWWILPLRKASNEWLHMEENLDIDVFLRTSMEFTQTEDRNQVSFLDVLCGFHLCGDDGYGACLRNTNGGTEDV